MAENVAFAGGLQIVAHPLSPVHSLSDLKILQNGDALAVTDHGHLVRWRVRLDEDGQLTGLDEVVTRPLIGPDGEPLQESSKRDAEGLALLASGEVLVAFEREHRIWNYGPAAARRPAVVASPETAFPLNAGMEGLAANGGAGWRVAGESGGIWDCVQSGCDVVAAPPAAPLEDREFRITGVDRDPRGDGWLVVQRSYQPPIDARARVRRMGEDGSLGPVLIELKLPGTTDNFEGVAAVETPLGVRLYILSDDNGRRVQRTLLLAFDLH